MFPAPRKPTRNPEGSRLVMSFAAAAICAVLAYLSYNDGLTWQAPIWLGMGVVLAAIPLLPFTRNHSLLVQGSRWLTVAVAIGLFIWEIFRRRAG